MDFFAGILEPVHLYIVHWTSEHWTLVLFPRTYLFNRHGGKRQGVPLSKLGGGCDHYGQSAPLSPLEQAPTGQKLCEMSPGKHLFMTVLFIVN